ncbi:MAG: PhnB protein [Candidatus Eremiobacteraeota bacterium]|nr:PhnB protein [Candidatus Eremiobacteraeota bacterium]
MEIEPYLHFRGQCEEALNFYASVFGGEITSLNRFAGSPLMNELPPEYASKIMHANFKAPNGVKFMASDGRPNTTHAGDSSRISLSVSTADVAEGERTFRALAEGGKISMDYQKTFWGATFGMLTDKYGIDWMVNAGQT